MKPEAVCVGLVSRLASGAAVETPGVDLEQTEMLSHRVASGLLLTSLLLYKHKHPWSRQQSSTWVLCRASRTSIRLYGIMYS